jgi:predicted metal-dependent hydrolase
LPPAHDSYRLKTTAILSRVQLGLPFSVGSTTAQVAAEPQPAPPGIQFYFVRHRRARRYLLRVEPDGRVRVTIPRGGSKREADAFANRHLDWIVRQRARLPEPSVVETGERRALIHRAKRELPVRLLQLAAAHGITVTRVSIRNQRSRWGSCGHDGHICLNWRLVRMPDWVRDYVIIHELMHVLRMDHSAAYWKLVGAAFPDYQAARAWLRVHGRTL